MNERELLEAQRVARLVAGFIGGTLNKQQAAALDEWIADNDDNMMLFEKLTDEKNMEWTLAWFRNLDVESALHSVGRKISPAKKKKFPVPVLYYAAAALLVLFIGFFIYKYYLPAPEEKKKIFANGWDSIRPGTKKAILLVAGGKQINLSEMKDQTIEIDSSVHANNSHYILSYNGNNQNRFIINTLQVPPGGEYQVVLADGTKVWMNAGSSLTYPTAFTESNRLVDLSGEAYFEVAKDKTKPFIVKAGKTTITVTGTHFNVSAYTGESRQMVSLLEGSVNVARGNFLKALEPNQQAVIGEATILVTSPVNINSSIAWTKGRFSFDKNSIEEVMQQVTRWYDVKARYAGKINQQFTGEVFRNSSLQEVIQMLEITGNLKIEIKNKTLIIRPGK